MWSISIISIHFTHYIRGMGCARMCPSHYSKHARERLTNWKFCHFPFSIRKCYSCDDATTLCLFLPIHSTHLSLSLSLSCSFSPTADDNGLDESWIKQSYLSWSCHATCVRVCAGRWVLISFCFTHDVPTHYSAYSWRSPKSKCELLISNEANSNTLCNNNNNIQCWWTQ